MKRVSLQCVPLENIHFCPCSSNWNRSSLHQCFQDPTESENLANKHPELVKELLAEAELVLKDAPMQVGCAVVEGGSRDISIYMQVRGDMVDADGPMGPDQKTWGGWWSVLRTLGSDHPRVRDSHQMM